MDIIFNVGNQFSLDEISFRNFFYFSLCIFFNTYFPLYLGISVTNQPPTHIYTLPNTCLPVCDHPRIPTCLYCAGHTHTPAQPACASPASCTHTPTNLPEQASQLHTHTRLLDRLWQLESQCRLFVTWNFYLSQQYNGDKRYIFQFFPSLYVLKYKDR